MPHSMLYFTQNLELHEGQEVMQKKPYFQELCATVAIRLYFAEPSEGSG